MIEIVPVEGLPEIREGDDLGAWIADATSLRDGDVIVVAQKAVSKAEGRVVALDGVEPSAKARELAGPGDRSAAARGDPLRDGARRPGSPGRS